MENTLTLSLLIMIGTLAGTFVGRMFVALCKYIITKKPSKDEPEPKPDYSKNILAVRYSEQILDFIRTISVQSAVMKYQEFADGHDIDKITRAQVQNLVIDISVETKNHVNLDVIDYNELLYDRQFIEGYIIQNSISTVKRMLEKSINDAIE